MGDSDLHGGLIRLHILYHITRRGRAALGSARIKAQELFGELFEER